MVNTPLLLDAMLLIVTGTSRVVFFTVMNLSALVVPCVRDANVVVAGVTDSVASPDPDIGMLGGPAVEEFGRLSVAPSEPIVVGLKFTVTVQDPDGASDAPQVVPVLVKFEALGPVTVKAPVKLIVTGPEFFSVTTLPGLVVSTARTGKTRLEGVTVIV